MQLQAILLPPPEVIEGVVAATSTLAIVQQPEVAEPAGSGLGRLFKKPPPPPRVPSLEVVPFPTPSVKVLRFGNVTTDDAHALGQALTMAATGWRAPALHVVGIQIEQTSTQFVVKAELGGDTELAWDIFRSVNAVARTQRFFLDRRSFAPEFAFAALTIDGESNPSQVETVPEFSLGRAASYTGPTWHATYLDLVSVPHSPTLPLEAVAEVPLRTDL